MFIISCPKCNSINIFNFYKNKDEQFILKKRGKVIDSGHDWFHCKECNNNFTLQNSMQ
jgi:hypothetical protein